MIVECALNGIDYCEYIKFDFMLETSQEIITDSLQKTTVTDWLLNNS